MITNTDVTFEESKPGYYIYGEEHVEHCILCGRQFKTRLELNRFCSAKHKEALLGEFAGERHGRTTKR